MNVIMDDLSERAKKRWMKEGNDKPVPKSGFPRYWFLLVSHFWKLIGANLLFLAFSLPLLTLPASLTALNRVCIKLVREGNCFLWQEFWGEFRSSLWQSLLLGLPYGALLAGSYYMLSLGISNASTIYGICFSAIGLSMLLFCVGFGSWAFVLIAMVALPNRDIQRNARVLAMLELKRTFAVFGLGALTMFLTLVLYPFSLVFQLFLLPAFMQFTVCFLMSDRIQERVIAPYEAKHSS